MLPRLLVDENLARLARWCRFLGMDVVLPGGWSDREVSALARAEARLLVSRDRELCQWHRARSLWVPTDDFRAQLRLVSQECGVPEESAWFTRCALCNEPLRLLSAEERQAHARLPDNWRAQPCWECPACGRAFWRGSHIERTRVVLREALRL